MLGFVGVSDDFFSQCYCFPPSTDLNSLKSEKKINPNNRRAMAALDRSPKYHVSQKYLSTWQMTLKFYMTVSQTDITILPDRKKITLT